MSTFHVCIVDDDPMARMVAADALAGHDYQITECESGADCLALFAPGDPFDFDATPAAPPPDVVLLDIEMPALDGYEVCRQLRASGHDVQVIFVSGRDDLESRLAGFDVGGSDFIVKPYAPKELRHHVEQIEIQAQRQHEQAEMLSYAQKTAFSAMSSMGEMGAVLQFIRDSFACSDARQLAQKLLDAHAAYGLAALVELHTDAAPANNPASRTCLASHGECNELEISILDYARKLGRLKQLGNRLVLNYPHITLVVIDLPLADRDKVDRLRDHLAIIAEGATARMQGLRVEAARAAQTTGIITAVSALTATFAEIDEQQRANRQTAFDVAAQFHEKLLYAFLGMGLSTIQEVRITEMAEDAMKEIAAALANQAALAIQLKETADSLTGLIQSPEKT